MCTECDDNSTDAIGCAARKHHEIMERREPFDEIKITPDIIRAGVAAYYEWNPEDEEPEALVSEIFYKMLKQWRTHYGS